MTGSTDGTIPPSEVSRDPSEERLEQMKDYQVSTLNNMFEQQNRKARKRRRANKFLLVEEPDNVWRDRYLLCGDCERRNDYDCLPPKPDCQCSTLLEVDMTAPFSRSNVMAVSCRLVQLIREDVWVRKDAAGEIQVAEEKRAPGTFPIQVCCTCRKTSIEEGRRFITCTLCRGAHYCSDECFQKHRFKHRTSCTRPTLPYRSEWGIRKVLRKMRDEIYPLIKRWAIKAASQHMIAWKKRPQRLLTSPQGRPGLGPGAAGSISGSSALATRNGEAIVPRKLTMSKRRVRSNSRPRPASKPSEETLLNLGMTEVEFAKKDEAWQAKYDAGFEERQARILAVAKPEGELKELWWDPPRIDPSKPQYELPPKKEKRKLVLDTEAIGRLDELGEIPSEAPLKPLWDGYDIDSPEQRARHKVEAVDMGPVEIDKKPGVVYETQTQKIAKKRKLVLSEEALERLETVGRLSRSHEEQKKEWFKPLIDTEKRDRMFT